MELLTAVLGILLIVVAGVDAVLTTISLGGGGPLTTYVARGLWAILPRRRSGGGSSIHSKLVGPSILLALFAVWALLFWVGWALLFLSASDAVVNSKTGAPAGLWDRAYYAGYLLTTLGIGDYRPQGTFFQLITPVAAGSGFFLITLAVTYLLSVLSAVIAKRQLAFSILSLGRTPAEMILRSWTHSGFSQLASQVDELSEDVVMLAQQHLAYPVLHYFQTEDVRMSPTVALAVLDEALSLLLHATPAEHRPDPPSLLRTRLAIELFAETVAPHQDTGGTPPPPALEPLRDGGVPVVDDSTFHASLEELRPRRQRLARILENEGWQWDTVIHHPV